MRVAVALAAVCSGTWALRKPMLAAEHRPRMRLVVCNAVADDAPIAVRQNGGYRLLSGLGYETCAEAGGLIAEHDELEFLSPIAGAWTFQVGPLPAGSGGLLLVFEQASSHHPSFRAVAFPEVSEEAATVAVLDALHHSHRETPKPRPALRVAAAQKDAKPPEALAADGTSLGTTDLEFDHVYSLDAGDFEVSLAGGLELTDAATEAATETRSAMQLHAAPKGSYVVLRTGRPDLGYPEHLLVVPGLDPVPSAAALLGLLLLPLLA